MPSNIFANSKLLLLYIYNLVLKYWYIILRIENTTSRGHITHFATSSAYTGAQIHISAAGCSRLAYNAYSRHKSYSWRTCPLKHPLCYNSPQPWSQYSVQREINTSLLNYDIYYKRAYSLQPLIYSLSASATTDTCLLYVGYVQRTGRTLKIQTHAVHMVSPRFGSAVCRVADAKEPHYNSYNIGSPLFHVLAASILRNTIIYTQFASGPLFVYLLKLV